jgi:hypothetical protein
MGERPDRGGHSPSPASGVIASPGFRAACDALPYAVCARRCAIAPAGRTGAHAGDRRLIMAQIVERRARQSAGAKGERAGEWRNARRTMRESIDPV